MQAMSALFSAGGNVFWVAPSGGRDRPAPDSDSETFVVSPFDLKALDMFKLVAMQSGKVRFQWSWSYAAMLDDIGGDG